MSRLAAAARYLEKKTFPPLKLIGGISTLILVVMMLITVADATGRRLFSRPIAGTYEFVSYLLCLLFFGSICYCGLDKNHLSITVITSLMPDRIRNRIFAAGRVLSAILSFLMAWRLLVTALGEKAAGTHGMQLTSVPLYPFIMVGALGMLILGWILLVEGISSIGSTSEA